MSNSIMIAPMPAVQRFAGAVKAFASVEIGALADWISAIPLNAWHQQGSKPSIPLRPAMMTDLTWHEFGARTDAVVADLMAYFPRCAAYQRMLSAVMPNDEIPPHRDDQADYWMVRVHVPLLGNEDAIFWVDGEAYTLVPGTAYLVNTLAIHGVTNRGREPRIHFMFDVRLP